MRSLSLAVALTLVALPSFANTNCSGCCNNMGGINYCDSSAGRYICRNGEISSCYCSRHAVMNMQKFEGCCMWQGGVFKIDPVGLVICNNGAVSEVCSIQHPTENVAAF